MQLIPYVVFIPILAALGYYDLKRNIIPNKITYPGAVLAVTLNAIYSDITLPMILAGGLVSLMAGIALAKFSKLGGGDLKFFIVIGFMFGIPWCGAVFLGAFLLGGLVMLKDYYVARKESKELKGETPFGIFLAFSGLTVCGWLIFVIMQF